MVVCSVLGCNNSPGRNNNEHKIRFHYFPKDPKLCQLWIKACGNKNKYSLKNSRVCSEHFVETDYRLCDILLNASEDKRSLKIGAVPSKNLPNECEPTLREKRQKVRQNKKIVNECLAAYEKAQKPPPAIEFVSVNNGDDDKPFDYNQQLKKSLDNNQEQQESFNDNQQNCLYYTNNSTQTEVEYNCSKELRIMELEKECYRLKRTLNKKNQQLQKYETMRTSIREIFTPSQIKQLEQPSKKPRWSIEDMSSSMSLYYAGVRSYKLLRKRNFPLPAPSTIRRWGFKQIKTNPSILNKKFLQEWEYLHKLKMK